ncbi:MAG: rhomboid family intramembrane serine protease [Chitinophagaceae bacterium]|nr:rhomboid family intramembrane serine protease [Chitinophagaceae bacterium]
MEFRPTRYDVVPTVVKNLLIINVLLFLATIVIGRTGTDISEYLALHHWYSDKFQIWQLITHMFMHGNVSGPMPDYEGGVMHLFSNMFALWMFGSLLENYFGPKRFLSFYLLCGMGAALFHLGVLTYEFGIIKDAIAEFQANPTYKQYSIWLSQSHISPGSEFGQALHSLKLEWMNSPMDDSFVSRAGERLQLYYSGMVDQATVGASGAVFGILFGFGYLFPNTLIYLYFFFPMKAKYFIALYALFELYAGVRNSAGDNIAHFAHLGGMVIAFIILKIWQRSNSKTRF